MSPAQPRNRVAEPALMLLALMMAIGPFGETEYAPAMPAMALALRSDYTMVQLTMTSYLIGSAVSRLFYGPLSDRFGRRPVMLAGAAIMALGAFLCLISFSIVPLISSRLVQGAGACAGGVIANAVVRDAFDGARRQAIYARTSAISALAPAVGPIAGIYLTEWLGWHANFGLLVVLSLLLCLLVWRYLPETNLNLDSAALDIARLRQHVWQTMTTPGFLLYSSLLGFSTGVVYTALIGAPDLVLNVLGLGNLGFMIVSLAILVSFVIGASLGALLNKKVPPDLFIGAGLALLLAASVWLLLAALLVGKAGDLATFLTPIGVCFIAVGMVSPVSTSRAMEPFGDNTGIASSLLGSIQMIVAALGTLGMSLLHEGTIRDIPIVFLALAFAACLIFIGSLSWRARATRRAT